MDFQNALYRFRNSKYFVPVLVVVGILLVVGCFLVFHGLSEREADRLAAEAPTKVVELEGWCVRKETDEPTKAESDVANAAKASIASWNNYTTSLRLSYSVGPVKPMDVSKRLRDNCLLVDKTSGNSLETKLKNATDRQAKIDVYRAAERAINDIAQAIKDQDKDRQSAVSALDQMSTAQSRVREANDQIGEGEYHSNVDLNSARSNVRQATTKISEAKAALAASRWQEAHDKAYSAYTYADAAYYDASTPTPVPTKTPTSAPRPKSTVAPGGGIQIQPTEDSGNGGGIQIQPTEDTGGSGIEIQPTPDESDGGGIDIQPTPDTGQEGDGIQIQ